MSIDGQIIKVYPKTAPCPVCGEATLAGSVTDLDAEQIDYNAYFLPTPRKGWRFEEPQLVGNLTLFDTYFCPHDLFTYSGRVRTLDTPKGPANELDPNVFQKMYVFFNPYREQVIGRRLAFFLNSLSRNFFKRERLHPPPEAGRKTEVIAKLIALLFQLAEAETPDFEQLYKVFQALRVEYQWNPLLPLTHNPHRSFETMAAVLELQLADLLYLHRRSMAKGVKPIPFRDLYETLERLRQLTLSGGSLDEDLAGNVIFHCLKMAEFFRDTRRYDCLRTVYALTKFMVQIRSRVGADINRRLDALAGNADVMFYLSVRLGRDLHDNNALDRATLNLLQRRLNSIADYSYPGATEESVRIARIGRFLKQFLQGLQAEAAPAAEEPTS